uniref:Uncharacterized protein n=1 Tax=Lepeophtheirus salmonis TaxID=72036 RepID=A0A0K2VI35_LEPSM
MTSFFSFCPSGLCQQFILQISLIIFISKMTGTDFGKLRRHIVTPSANPHITKMRILWESKALITYVN